MSQINTSGPMAATGGQQAARVSARGARRWESGHPWIYRSDVVESPGIPGVVSVQDERGKFLGQALCSPRSEIRLRLLDTSPNPIDGAWWRDRINAALVRRTHIDANAFRIVHGEGDGLPSLVVDRYDRWLVVQLLSAGLETVRGEILEALRVLLVPSGILLRNDVGVRRHEGLAEEVELVEGEVPDRIAVREGSVQYWAAPHTGQKTGAFLDQRPARLRAGALTKPGGRALDCFAYHGSFALHMAGIAGEVVALDSSEDALARGQDNAALNEFTNIRWVRGDAFETLRRWERQGERFDTIVVDPPAFAKTKAAIPGALRGYREINLRAMRLLTPGGVLITASCSFHLRRPDFMRVLEQAAGDSGRRLTILEYLGQGPDHPEVMTIPETGYLKGLILRAD